MELHNRRREAVLCVVICKAGCALIFGGCANECCVLQWYACLSVCVTLV